MDVGICHPCPLTLEPMTSQKSDDLVRSRVEGKDAKYKELCRAAGQRFHPFIITTWGSFGPGAEALWKEMVKRVAAPMRGRAREWRVEELQQGLSLALMAGVGRQLQHIQLARERSDPEEAPFAPSLPMPAS